VVAPYWSSSDGRLVIYHGDARDVLPEIRADVLVTDPPYGVDFSGKATRHTAAGSGGYTTVDDAKVGPLVVREALGKIARGAVFPGIRNLMSYPPAQDIGGVYCPSGAGIGPWGFVCFHPVLFYGKRLGKLRPSSMVSFATADVSWHPCPKPFPWMRWLVGMVSLPDDTVLEPFLGSGTTLLAAQALGRRAIGIDIEETYCEGAARRLEDPPLLAAVKAEQMTLEVPA
jgi:DNA modification methylase